jgi:signal transduction histidine kinase
MAPPRPTLLIVDDEPDVLDSLRHFFHRGYHVLTASTAVEGLRLLESQRDPVKVILSDQRMPGMTGDEFLARARELVPDATRLLFTGYADIQAVIKAINQGGIFRYILKPWEPAELEATIRQAVAQYDLLAERRRLIAELQAANARLTEANRELAEADQLKTAFLEVASHELNTPITIVQGLAELMALTDPQRPEPEREIIRQIGEATRRLARLVENMLKLVVAGEFRESLRTRPVELGQLIRDAVRRVRPFVEARRLGLDLDLADALGTFELDADKIGDVLLNLLSNAIKFTPDEGTVAVSARLVGPDEAEVRIADSGIGLEPRALQRLFSPFFTQHDPSRHSSGQFGFGQRGLGLGLYLVKVFVEQHGGTVAAASEWGRGTTITLRLPRKPCPEAVGPVQYPGATPTAENRDEDRPT